MGGAAGEAYANTLKSPGMHPEHVLAREAIQNSVDAELEGQKVRVCFRHKRLINSAKTAFIEAAGLSNLAARADALELPAPNCLPTLDKPKTPLSLLYIEDHNALGLPGDPHDKNSNFHRLLLSLGDRSKNRNSKGSGGSYGFGKAVYSASSAIQTIFAYTRFATGKGEEEKTRVFGCGYYQGHEFKKKSFGGRAWFGVSGTHAATGTKVVDPFEGAAADKLAARLGFEPRHPGDLGTTILVVDSDVDLADIVLGVEDWWWPRLIDQKLDVEIHDATGAMSVPRPKMNAQLRPFIEAFDLAVGRAEPKSKSQKAHTLPRLLDMPLGVCGMVAVPLGENGAPIVQPERWNSVALIRSPLMVVAYKSFSDMSPYVVGAFVAADEVNLVLRKSEPPAHDRWDEDSGNLKDADGAGKASVRAVLARIKSGLKRFQGEVAPPLPPKQQRMTFLERALGSYFRPDRVGPPPPPPSGDSLVHLEFTKQPYAEATPEGMLRLRAAFTVSLDAKAGDDPVELRLKINCPVLEDAGHEGDELALDIKAKGVKVVPDPEEPAQFKFEISKGGKAHFTVESEPYDPAWTVRLRPEIDDEVAA